MLVGRLRVSVWRVGGGGGGGRVGGVLCGVVGGGRVRVFWGRGGWWGGESGVVVYIVAGGWGDGVKVGTRPGGGGEGDWRGGVRERIEGTLGTLRRSGGRKLGMRGCDEGGLEGDAGLGLPTSTRYVEAAAIG